MVSVGQNPLTFILAILAWVAHLDPWEGNILPQWPEFEGERACKGAFLAVTYSYTDTEVYGVGFSVTPGNPSGVS